MMNVPAAAADTLTLLPPLESKQGKEKLVVVSGVLQPHNFWYEYHSSTVQLIE